jgi:hypothetical protein
LGLGPAFFGQVREQIGAHEQPPSSDFEGWQITTSGEFLDLLRGAEQQFRALIGVDGVGHAIASGFLGSGAHARQNGSVPLKLLYTATPPGLSSCTLTARGQVAIGRQK